MKFTIDKTEFLKGLQIAQNVADRKSTMPIAANVLLECKKGLLQVGATNLVVSVRAKGGAKVEEEGGITTSAKTIFDVVKSLPDDPDQEILFTKSETNFAEISVGKVRFQIVGMSHEDFPKLPEPGKLIFEEVDAQTLSDLVSKVFFSISPEETRPHLNAAFVEADGKTLRMVSTDGHRLSRAEAPVGNELKFNGGVLIPRRGVQEIRRLVEGDDGKIEMALGEGHLFLRNDYVLMAVKLSEEKFPPYEEVIPKDLDKKIVLLRTAFMEALRRVSLLSTEKTHGIRFRFSEGKLEILSRNPDLGEASEEMEVDYEGEEFVIAFNARYFVDALSEMVSEEVILEFGEELDPCVLQPVDTSDYLVVIMPLRL